MEVAIADLWLPILVSAVAVFFISFMMWMVFPHHKSDWKGLSDEEGFMNKLRDMSPGRGQYSFPFCAGKESWKDPDFLAKYAKGPKGFLVTMPDGPGSMGKNMGISFFFNLLITLLVAYVASRTLVKGDDAVLQITSTVAFLGFGGALGWNPIWFGRTWSSTLKEMFDALVYAMATGAIFMAFWPGAPTP